MSQMNYLKWKSVYHQFDVFDKQVILSYFNIFKTLIITIIFDFSI